MTPENTPSRFSRTVAFTALGDLFVSYAKGIRGLEPSAFVSLTYLLQYDLEVSSSPYLSFFISDSSNRHGFTFITLTSTISIPFSI